MPFNRIMAEIGIGTGYCDAKTVMRYRAGLAAKSRTSARLAKLFAKD